MEKNKVILWDWTRGTLLQAAGHKHGEELMLTSEETGQLAIQIYESGADVMLHHLSESEGMRLSVDSPRWHFTQH